MKSLNLSKLALAGLLLFSAGCTRQMTLGLKADAITQNAKYPAKVKPLSREHRYLRSSDAPDFWLVNSFYLPQQTSSACSLATVTALVNVARSRLQLSSSDELSTQNSVLQKVNDRDWTRRVAEGGDGVTLDLLPDLIKKSFIAFSLKAPTLSVVHVNDVSPETLKRFTDELIANEKSSFDLIVLNFDQGLVMEDESAGHMSIVGAYDEKNKLVLVMDVDRTWFEPYWVSVDTLLQSMNTQDSEVRKNRGYLVVQL